MAHIGVGVPRLPEPPKLWTPEYMREFIRVMVLWMRAQQTPDEEELGEEAIRTVTTDSLMGTSDGALLVDASGSGVTITLPDPSTVVGRPFTVKKIDTSANIVGVVCASSQIERRGGWYLTTPYASATFKSDGVEYWMVASVTGGLSIVAMPSSGSLTLTGYAPTRTP